jgi:hypothetical protein
MTEFEVLEIVNSYASNAMSSFSMWATFTFAYLTAAYLAGRELSRFQVITISSLYFIAAASFALAGITYVRSFEETFAAYPEFVPSNYWYIPWTILGYILIIGGMAASLYFMYDIRKKVQK